MSSRLPTKPKLPTLAERGAVKYNKSLNNLIIGEV